MKDVRITIDSGSRRGQYEVSLQLDDSITCGETVQLLVDSLELRPSRRKGRWQLVERWKGCGESKPFSSIINLLHLLPILKEKNIINA